MRLAKMDHYPIHARDFDAAAGLGPGGLELALARLSQFKQSSRPRS